MTSVIVNISAVVEAGSVTVSTGTTGLSGAICEVQGGVSISPGGAQGGETSPPKDVIASTHVKAAAAASRSRFFILSPLPVELMFRSFPETLPKGNAFK